MISGYPCLARSGSAIWKVRQAWIWSWGEPVQIESVPQRTLFSPDVLEELAHSVRGGVGVAAEHVPGGAHVRVDVAVRRDVVVEQRLHQRVDAVAAGAGLERQLGVLRIEARVIHQEVHVRELACGFPDVVAAGVLVARVAAERDAFVDADVADADGAGPLDEGRAVAVVVSSKPRPVCSE